VQLRFDEIERVLGFKLPKSAYDYEAWWSNNAVGHSHARAWLDAGWKTEDVDLAKRQVSFRRSSPPRARRKSDPWGCMADTISIMPGTDLTAPSGEEWTSEKGLLHE
jgi:hypothetical protein